MPDFYYANLHTLDTIKPRLFWLTLTTYAYKAIQALDRKMAEKNRHVRKRFCLTTILILTDIVKE